MVEQSFQDAIRGIPFLKDVKKGEEFVMSNGERIKSMLELQNVLASMDESIFRSHVTPDKNDFAAWIYHSIGDHELAERLGPLKSQAQNLLAVKQRVRECANFKIDIRRKKSH